MSNQDPTLHLSEADTSVSLEVPFQEGGIKAGFPSPAADYQMDTIDLNKTLVRHRESTFYARVAGNSLMDAGISDGDLVVIDKALEARSGDFVAAFIDGEFTLKRFELDEANNCAWLIPANKAFHPIKVTEENSFVVWGVLTYTIKKLY